MRYGVLAVLAALSAGACGQPAAPGAAGPAQSPAAAVPPPTTAREPARLDGPVAGRWKVSITAAGMSLPPQEVCYEKQMTLSEANSLQQSAGMTCSEQSFQPSPGGMSGRSVCTMAGTTITTDMRMTGDFSTAYTMDMTAMMNPAPPGAPNPSRTSVRMERLGSCDAGTPAPAGRPQ